MDLFGKEVSAVPAANQPAAEAEARALEAKEPEIPTIEIAAPSKKPSSNPPKTPTGQGGRQASLQEASKRSGPTPQPTPEIETAEADSQPRLFHRLILDAFAVAFAL
jgi:hypothetical protein